MRFWFNGIIFYIPGVDKLKDTDVFFRFKKIPKYIYFRKNVGYFFTWVYIFSKSKSLRADSIDSGINYNALVPFAFQFLVEKIRKVLNLNVSSTNICLRHVPDKKGSSL